MKYPIWLVAAVFTNAAYAQSDVVTPDAAVRLAWSKRPNVAAAEAEVQRELAVKSSTSAHPATRFLLGRGTDRVPGSTDNDLAIVQPLDIFGVRRAAGAIGEARVQLAKAKLRLLQQEVQAEVLARFNQVVSAKRRLTIALELLEIARKLRDGSQRKFDLGEIAEVQVLRSTIEQERAAQTVALRTSDFQVAESNLRRAIGLPATALMEVSPIFYTSADLSEEEMKGKRGDLLILDSELKIAQAEIRAESLLGRPELDLEFRRSPWTQESQFGLRLQLSMPIYDFGRKSNATKAAQLRRDAAEHRYQDALNRAKGDWEIAQIKLASEREQVSRLMALREQALKLVQLAQLGYDRGAYTLTETLEAGRAFREVEDALIDAELRQAQAGVELITAAGFLLEGEK